MSPSHLANVERGFKRYNMDMLEAMAKALHCEPWELIGYAPTGRAASTSERSIFLREWRKHRGLTQEALAAAAAIDHTVISKLETGKIGYTQAILEALSGALACKAWQLIGVDPLAPADDVFGIWDRIPEAGKAQARRTLQSFLPEQNADR